MITTEISVENFMGDDYVVETYRIGNTTHKRKYQVEY